MAAVVLVGDRRVGAALFERTSRRVSLTSTGVLLRDRIRVPYDELAAGFNETRAGDVDMLAMRLPVHAADLAVEAALSSEQRVVVLARDHPLAGRASVGLEDLAGYTIAVAAALPRETVDALMPGATPSGRPITRATVRTFAEGVMRIARGELVHTTVRSFVDHYGHPHVTFVPMDDPTPSETALVRLAANRDARVRAFADTAASVLAERSP